MGTLAISSLVACLLLAEPPAAAYDKAVSQLAQDRATLAASYRAAKTAKAHAEVLAQARARLLEAIDRDLIPAWLGTPWEFYGDSERPREGAIACGYFVTTVLRDAGLKVERVLLAQQASEYIVKTLTPEARILRLRNVTRAQVVEAARKKGDGLYVVGLDLHVGFLRLSGEDARFCHSSYLGTRAVVCEKAEDAPAMASGYYVLGDALGDLRILDWLQQTPIRLRTR